MSEAWERKLMWMPPGAFHQSLSSARCPSLVHPLRNVLHSLWLSAFRYGRIWSHEHFLVAFIDKPFHLFEDVLCRLGQSLLPQTYESSTHTPSFGYFMFHLTAYGRLYVSYMIWTLTNGRGVHSLINFFNWRSRYSQHYSFQVLI